MMGAVDGRSIGDLSVGMASKLRHGADWFETRDLHWELGFLGVVDFRSRLDRSHASSNGRSIVIYGDIYSSGDSKIPGEDQARVALYLYEKHGADFLKQLNGSFVVSVYDSREEKLLIATDRHGSRNLFYRIRSDRNLLFSSEIKAILVDPSLKPRLNHEAVAEFFTFSYPLGNKTFFEGIELLGPGAVLTYDVAARNLSVESYWDLEFHRRDVPRSLECYLREFDSVMERAVELRMRDRDRVGILLSGGVDSRLMAGYVKRIADREGRDLVSFTFGTRGGWQQRIAHEVADALGIENRFHEIRSDCVAKYAEEVVYKGDGHMRIRDAHFVALLGEVRAEVEYVLVGFLCDTVFGAHLDKSVLRVSGREQLADYLFKKYRVEQVAKYVESVFSEDFLAGIRETARRNFANTVLEIPFDACDDIVHYWDLRQRGRRYMFPMLSYIRWYLDAADPYADNEVVDFAVGLPPALKRRKRFIYLACKAIFPKLASIPLESVGRSLRSTETPLLVTSLGRLFSKTGKTLVERLSLGRILFRPKDYRGYEYWIRTGSRTYVETLFADKPVEILNQRGVREVIKDHMRGRRNHDQLICDLINLELAAKAFFPKGIR